MPKHDFEKLLLEAVDEGLSSLGDSSKQAIYFHLDNRFNIKKWQIPSKIEAFENAIQSIFGAGANFLEIVIMKQLYEKVGGTLGHHESAKLTFAEYAAKVKKALQEKTVEATTELIVCEDAEIEV